MQNKPQHTIVVMPDDKKLDVSYYCADDEDGKKNKNSVNVIIQLDDCHSSVTVPKEKMKQRKELERIVQKAVINAKGHLCD